jgi:uncharacterized protein YdaU (DUF1376 family)
MSPPWMPFYVTDYLGDTTHLSTLEHGAYVLLLLHYWQHEGLPEEEEDLAIITRLQLRDWKKMQPKISKLFKPGWRHKRVDAELAKAVIKYDRRAAAGKAGGNARAQAMANAKQTGSNATSKDLANGVAEPKQTATNSQLTSPYGESSQEREPQSNQDRAQSEPPAANGYAYAQPEGAAWYDDPFGPDLGAAS